MRVAFLRKKQPTMPAELTGHMVASTIFLDIDTAVLVGARLGLFTHVGQGLLILFFSCGCEFDFCFPQLFHLPHIRLIFGAGLSSVVRRIANNAGKTFAGAASHERVVFRIAQAAAFAPRMGTCSICALGVDRLIEQELVITLKCLSACMVLKVAVL
jgi:hypothetical protein